MKQKRKKLDEVKVSKDFLIQLLAPFHPMRMISDFVIDEDKVIILCRKEVTENTPQLPTGKQVGRHEGASITPRSTKPRQSESTEARVSS